MKVKIYTEKEFERQLRKLSKKYRSMLDDYDAFLTGLAHIATVFDEKLKDS